MADDATTAQKRPRAVRASGPTTPDPIEMAMEAEASGRAPDGVVHEVLKKQSLLLGWQVAKERAGYWLRVLTVLVGAAVAVLVGLVIWQAAQADGLVIEAFSVPPALAQDGVTGEAVAHGLMDHITAMAEISRSAERQRGLDADWGQKVSIQIAQTGISIDQIERWLRERLGDQVHLTGEVMKTPDGRLKLVSRVGAHAVAEQVGAPEELPHMMQAAAEAIYEHEQPVSYSGYLARQGRWADLLAASQRMAEQHDPAIQVAGYVAMGNALQQLQGVRAALRAYEQAHAIDPVAYAASTDPLAATEFTLGHYERSVALMREFQRNLRQVRSITPEARRQRELDTRLKIGFQLGDSAGSLAAAQELAKTSRLGFQGSEFATWLNIAHSYAGLHDGANTRAAMARWISHDPGDGRSQQSEGNFHNRMFERWDVFLTVMQQQLRQCTETQSLEECEVVQRQPGLRALGFLRNGRIPEAEALIATTGLDCYPCVIVRGQIADAQARRAEADRWFAMAARLAPSIPDAQFEWGRALLGRGDPAGAQAHFEAAHQASPRYADAIAYMGEALLGQKKYGPAIAQFSAADRIAPNWGRNHLLWGEALARQGKAAEARRQWAKAQALDLTPAERTRLTQERVG